MQTTHQSKSRQDQIGHLPRTSESRSPIAYVCVTDDSVRDRVSTYLQGAGYAVVAFIDGTRFFFDAAEHPSSARSWEPDLVVGDTGDWNHPYLELLQGIVELDWKVPIVVLAERDHEVRSRNLYGLESSIVFIDPEDTSELLAFAALIRFQRGKAVQ